MCLGGGSTFSFAAQQLQIKNAPWHTPFIVLPHCCCKFLPAGSVLCNHLRRHHHLHRAGPLSGDSVGGKLVVFVVGDVVVVVVVVVFVVGDVVVVAVVVAVVVRVKVGGLSVLRQRSEAGRAPQVRRRRLG